MKLPEQKYRTTESDEADTNEVDIEEISQEDFTALYAVYDEMKIPRNTPLQILQKTIREAYRGVHTDKNQDAADAQTKSTALGEKKGLVDRLSTLPAYKLTQQSSLFLIGSHVEFAEDLIRRIMTFTIHEGNTQTHVSPPAELVQRNSPIIRDFLAELALFLINTSLLLNLTVKPTVIQNNPSELHLINANNYTFSELVHLYRLIITGKITLPYPLRYAEEKTALEGHKLLTNIINLEQLNRNYYAAARMEVSRVKYAKKLSNALWVIATIAFLAGMLMAGLVSAFFPVFAASHIFAYTCVAIGIVIPGIFAIASLAYDHFSLKNFNTLVSNARPMIGDYFFTNLGRKDICLDMKKFINADKNIDKLGRSEFTSTPAEALKPATFYFSERAGNYFGDFWRLLTEDLPNDEDENDEIECDSPRGLPGPSSSTSMNDID